MRWRRTVESELTQLRLTFTQWLVLDATNQLVRETGDAVSQVMVAARLELDQMTVSQVMRTLSRTGLVDRGISAGRPAYRIIVTARGQKLAADGRARVEAASRLYEESAGERR